MALAAPLTSAADAITAAGAAPTALAPLLSRAVLPLRDGAIDALFAPFAGLPSQGLTEVAGEAGAGKTQLCMTWLARAALPAEAGGRGEGALVLNAEDA
jgi:RecA/RadA recombinase